MCPFTGQGEAPMVTDGRMAHCIQALMDTFTDRPDSHNAPWNQWSNRDCALFMIRCDIMQYNQ
jgi:hypothetical protein